MLARARPWGIAVAALIATVAAAQTGAAGRIAYQGRLVVGTRGIVVMTDSGDNPVELPHPPGSDCVTPALSPDGNTLAYAAKAEDAYKLWVARLAPDNSLAGEPEQITSGPSHDEQPAWSPDGKRLAYVSATKEEAALMTIPLAGGPPSQVATLARDFRHACPDWSPDGSSVVYSSGGKLFIVDADAGDARELVDDGMYPSWSPDGDHIAFFAHKPEPALSVISPQGGRVRALVTEVEFFGETAWSPDGRYVAFKADGIGGIDGNLWMVPAAGGEAKPLRSYGVAHGYLDWSGEPMTVAAAPTPAGPALEPVSAPSAEPTSVPPPAQGSPTPAADESLALAPVTAVEEPVKPAEAPAQEAAVRIISPAEGAAVRGITKIIVSKDEPGGYMSFFVDGRFAKATVAPFEMDWDTRYIPDGPYTVAATGYGAAGEAEGRVEVRVEVRNAISEDTLPEEGAELRYRFKTKEKWDYDVRVRAKAGAKGEVPMRVVAQQGGALQAVIRQRVEDVKEVVSRPAAEEAVSGAPAEPPQAKTVATIITHIRSGRLDAPGAGGRLPQVGQAARSSYSVSGEVTPLASPGGGQPIALGNLSLVFPEHSVKVGDTWRAPMTVLPLLRSFAVARVVADHRVDGLRWEEGRETMRVVSTFKAKALPVGLAGMSLRDVTGTRVTWFAYKEHRVVRMEDDIKGVFHQQAALAAAAAPAAPGPRAAPRQPAVQQRTAPRTRIPLSAMRSRYEDEDEDEDEAPVEWRGPVGPRVRPQAPGTAQTGAPAAPKASQVLHYALRLQAQRK